MEVISDEKRDCCVKNVIWLKKCGFKSRVLVSSKYTAPAIKYFDNALIRQTFALFVVTHRCSDVISSYDDAIEGFEILIISPVCLYALCVRAWSKSPLKALDKKIGVNLWLLFFK